MGSSISVVFSPSRFTFGEALFAPVLNPAFTHSCFLLPSTMVGKQILTNQAIDMALCIVGKNPNLQQYLRSFNRCAECDKKWVILKEPSPCTNWPDFTIYKRTNVQPRQKYTSQQHHITFWYTTSFLVETILSNGQLHILSHTSYEYLLLFYCFHNYNFCHQHGEQIPIQS